MRDTAGPDPHHRTHPPPTRKEHAMRDNRWG